MENMTVTNYGESRFIYFGDTVFEAGLFNNSDSGTLKQGCLLARDGSSGKFKKFTGSSDTPVAIYVGDDVSYTSSDLSVRVLISGKVFADKILVDDTKASAAQKDAAKANGIIPVASTEVNLQDNQ